MAGFNKICLIGNLGRDPELRYTQDGLAVANFNIAVNDWHRGGERTQWFRITAWRRLGEIAGEYLAKGKQVYVEGRLGVDEWEDRDGNKRFTLEVTASQLVLLGLKGDSHDSRPPSSAYDTPRSPSPSPAYNAPSPSPAPSPAVNNDQSPYDPEPYTPEPHTPEPHTPEPPAPESEEPSPQEDDIPF